MVVNGSSTAGTEVVGDTGGSDVVGEAAGAAVVGGGAASSGSPTCAHAAAGVSAATVISPTRVTAFHTRSTIAPPLRRPVSAP